MAPASPTDRLRFERLESAFDSLLDTGTHGRRRRLEDLRDRDPLFARQLEDLLEADGYDAAAWEKLTP